MLCRKHWFDDGANVVVDGGAVEGGAVAGGGRLRAAGGVGGGIPGVVGGLDGWVLGFLGLGTEGVRRYHLKWERGLGYDCCLKENWGTSCGFVAGAGAGGGAADADVFACGTLLPTCTSSVGPPLALLGRGRRTAEFKIFQRHFEGRSRCCRRLKSLPFLLNSRTTGFLSAV